jgi:hypothetical protein
MKSVKLAFLTIHNDVRIHPQRNATRTFMPAQGYTIEWYPPHLFRISIPHEIPTPSNPNPAVTKVYERWCAVTNCEAWEVAEGEEVVIQADLVQKALLSKLTALCEALSGKAPTAEKRGPGRPPKA